MADTLALRRKIKTAQNISKTTRAMQMIAASKLKKAQHAALSSRPYTQELMNLTIRLSPKNDISDLHPFLGKANKSNKTLYILISPDKGLCGGLVTNLIREYFKIRHDDKAVFVTVGKKIEGPVATGKKLLAAFPFGSTLPSYNQVLPLIDIINQEYLTGDVDRVKIIVTHFTSVFSQTPQIIDLLPVHLPEEISKSNTSESKEFIFEPSQSEILPELLKRYIEIVLFQQFLESYASYNAAQMIAMQNATNNAKDLVNDYQLLYNKARQERITNEILDITSAAVAIGAEV